MDSTEVSLVSSVMEYKCEKSTGQTTAVFKFRLIFLAWSCVEVNSHHALLSLLITHSLCFISKKYV